MKNLAQRKADYITLQQLLWSGVNPVFIPKIQRLMKYQKKRITQMEKMAGIGVKE